MSPIPDIYFCHPVGELIEVSSFNEFGLTLRFLSLMCICKCRFEQKLETHLKTANKMAPTAI